LSALDYIYQVNTVDGYGRAALHYAAERCDECVMLLVTHGADVDISDGSSDTPLHWAVFRDSADCITALLRAGANVDTIDSNRETPVTWAAKKVSKDFFGKFNLFLRGKNNFVYFKCLSMKNNLT